MKIVVLDGYTLNPGDLSWDKIAALGELTVHDRISYDIGEKDKIIEAARGAEVIFTNKTPVNRDIMDGLPDLKYIGVLATGYNIVDVKYAREKGITVTNIPAYSTPSVPQMTFSLLLEICFRTGDHDRAVKEGRWSSGEDFCFWVHPLMELSGKTMGIIGYGKIGQRVAKIAQAFDMSVLIYTRSKPDLPKGGPELVTLGELYKESDIISLHLPLFPETEGMINRDSISMMKDNVIIINTSRGALVDEKDMAEGLNSGKVGAFGADVVSREPISQDNPLLKAKNTILTPHIAWAPKESRMRLMEIAHKNLEAYLKDAPVNVVEG